MRENDGRKLDHRTLARALHEPSGVSGLGKTKVLRYQGKLGLLKSHRAATSIAIVGVQAMQPTARTSWRTMVYDMTPNELGNRRADGCSARRSPVSARPVYRPG